MPPRTRRKKPIYDSGVERYPDEPFYALDYEDVIRLVEQMCDDLISSLEEFAPFNADIQQFIAYVQDRKKFPDLEPVFLVILGEQGLGKSSLINALFDRNILETSGSSNACTALATLITSKDGADDKSRTSDIKIEFLNQKEYENCINGQVQRWTDVYPGNQMSDADEENEDDEEIEDYEEIEAIEDSSFDPNNSSYDDTSTDLRTSGTQGRTKISTKLIEAAGTAYEYFNILFDSTKDEKAKIWLEHVLKNTDIREGDFIDRCQRKAHERLAQIGAELGVCNGVAEIKDVLDKDLEKEQRVAKNIWPFVKLITIATGHRLSRHRVNVFDVPGYGDTSHLRRAVINDFRRKADYELVVVPSSRVATDSMQDSYVDRSIHLKGSKKTIVVMNRTDELINDDTVRRELARLTEAPFPSYKAQLEYLDALGEQGYDESDAVVRDATVAFIAYETDKVRKKLADKGIQHEQLFSASAGVYLKWINPHRKHDPDIMAEESGIPLLRQHLLRLTAKANYSNYRHHVFEVLSAIITRFDCINTEHVKDMNYVKIQQDSNQSVSTLGNRLKDLILLKLDDLVKSPWSSTDKANMSEKIELMIELDWIHTKIHGASFAKMLRENGIPVNGRNFGRNLNDDILKSIVQYVEDWHDKIHPRGEQLAQTLLTLIQTQLDDISGRLKTNTSFPWPRRQACEALDNASRRIALAYNTLLVDLNNKCEENRSRFTSEIDIYCPIARKMKFPYERAQCVQNGNGVYKRQRDSLIESIVCDERYPNARTYNPLVKNLENELVSQLQDRWSAPCDKFIAEAMAQLRDFYGNLHWICVNKADLSAKRKEAKKIWKESMNDYSQKLEGLKSRFHVQTPDHPSKRAKHDEHGGYFTTQ